MAARRTKVGGTTYRSAFESRVAATLPASFAYEPIRLSYTITHHYTPDFVDEANKQIIEAKGIFDSADRTKMLAIKRAYPDYQITIIFQNPHMKIAKKSKTTYADWCAKNNINWRTL